MNGTRIFSQTTSQGQLEVWDHGDKRSLWFDHVILQSEIYINDPAVLPNSVNQAMLAHLLFGQKPQSILLGGCGGGAIARWFHARSPATQGDAVDLSAETLKVARDWFDFPKQQWRQHQADIKDFIATPKDRYDFILVDIEEEQFSPEWLSSTSFLEHCKNALSMDGIITFNLIPHDATHYTQALWNIRQTFNHLTLSLPVEHHDNQLVIAFMQKPELEQIDKIIVEAASRWGLKLASYWEAIKLNNPADCNILNTKNTT